MSEMENKVEEVTEVASQPVETLEKAGIDPNTLNKNASLNTRSINTSKSSMSSKAQVKSMSQNEREEAVKKSTEYYNKNAKPGSIASKANMVKQYNEKNNK